MQGVDLQRYVLPSLLTLLVLGAFILVVTNGSGDGPTGAVAPPAPVTTSSPATTTTKDDKTTGTDDVTTATTTTSDEATTTSGRSYEVKPGDTPESIAREAQISTQRLLELNPDAQPSSLRPGQTLKLEP